MRARPSGAGQRRHMLLRVLALIVLVGLWEITACVMRNPTFIPPPAAVWHQLIQTSTAHGGVRGYSGHLLVEHLGVSLRRILVGSVTGVAGGLLLGVVLGTVSGIRLVVEPVVTFVRALPPLAYFGLFIIWFGIDETPKLWLLAIAALPPVAVATAAAVHAAPVGLVEAARALGASRSAAVRAGQRLGRRSGHPARPGRASRGPGAPRDRPPQPLRQSRLHRAHRGRLRAREQGNPGPALRPSDEARAHRAAPLAAG